MERVCAHLVSSTKPKAVRLATPGSNPAPAVFPCALCMGMGRKTSSVQKKKKWPE
ncbi:hypothetical protein BDA96_07G019000 [Sorghum bicolor]|uniref:Uncharacterized protein n=1 Tax=Sorghum bicolor TaxID=4558 RepID=A0A921QK31_SORBI|nr:hypothetical protein BDA96_07G019000 [Sorghum bicolor]